MTVAVPPAAGCPKLHRAVLLRKLPVSVWKDIISRQLRALHVDTIRGKILVFGLLATLVPTLATTRSEEHTSELQSRLHLVCRLLLEKKKKKINKLQQNIN